MSKKPLFKTNHEPSFQEIQAHWYGILEKEGFDEQEDTENPFRPLKKWSGVHDRSFGCGNVNDELTLIDLCLWQEPLQSIQSSFIHSLKREEELFQNHPELKQLCVTICNHGNSKLTPEKVELIWHDYCGGKTIRQSEVTYEVSDTTIFRVIQRITEWMRLMDTRNSQEVEQAAVIVPRAFNPESDSALIYSTWRNALWYDEKRDERLANEFYSLATKQIKEILSHPAAMVKIACDKADPDFIAGYAILVGDHLEFVYVKVNYRRKGIARMLTKGFQSVSTPVTKSGKKIVERKQLRIKENHEQVQ